eukprot:COSAG01_NODE_584_length_15174_cov_27.387901_17_plen_73_part_00
MHAQERLIAAAARPPTADHHAAAARPPAAGVCGVAAGRVTAGWCDGVVVALASGALCIALVRGCSVVARPRR